jgi:hyperosmotically inducible protein
VGCGLSLLVWLGCGRDSVIQVHRDNQGNDQVHINNQKIQDNLHKAGQELRQDASKVGDALKDGARDVDQKIGPSTRESLDDAALTAHVKARLIAAPDLGGIHIHVNSRNGEVTLSGTVSSLENRHDAEKIARNTKGVNAVVNQLEVGSVS